MATVIPEQSKSTEAGRSLQNQIAEVAKRVRLIGAVDACLWSIAAVGVVLFLLAWMDVIWHLPMSLRQGILPATILVGAVAFLWLLVRVWKGASSERIARRLDEVGETGGQILSGWELLPENADRNMTGQNDKTEALARGIASVAVSQASKRATDVDPAKAAPWSQSRRSSIVAGVVGLVMIAFAVIAPGAFGTSWNRFTAPTVDTPPYSPLQFDVSPGDIRLNYGKPLEVTASITGGGVENALLVLGQPDDPDAKRVAMFPRGGGRWQAVVPRVTESTTYCVTADRGRSRLFDLQVMETPKIESATFTITPPAYTSLPPREARYPQDRISGLSGTVVAFSIDANRPLKSGSVTLMPLDDESDLAPQTVDLSVSPDNPQRAVGEVTIKRSGNWIVSVTGANDVECESPIRLEVELLVDRPPIARIAQPRPQSYATPTTKVPVAAIGEDDFGVARMRIYRVIDGSRPVPLEIPIVETRRTVQGGSSLPLAAFGLEPGDKITLFARVDDTRPGASQGGESPLAHINIISQREFNRIIAAQQGRQMLENKFRQARRMLEELSAEAAKLQEELDAADPNDAEAQKELQEKVDTLREKMERAARNLEEIARQELPLEIDQEWNKALKEQAKALREAAKSGKSMKSEGKTAKEQADEMQKAIDKARNDQKQKIGQPMDALKKIAPILAAESKFVQLVERQRAVVDALDRYRQDDTVRDEADRQQVVQLREEEAAIRRELGELMQEIATAAEGLGDDPDMQELKQSSIDFVMAVGESPIDAELSEARQSLGRFDGADGYGHAITALEEMEKFLSQCKGNGKKAGNCLKKKFAPGLPSQGSNALQEMLNQMGLNSGPNAGYSMRGNSGQNVGLYGNQPFAQPRGGGRGDRNQMMPARGDGGSAAGVGSIGEDPIAELPETARTSSGDVPLRYRRQTEQYLRRIAESMDQ